MPPKKKKGKKKGKSEPELSGPEAEAELERKLLRDECKRLKEMRLREESLFNEYQQQKEKLNYFWIVEKKNLEDKKAEMRNKEREKQDLQEKHEVEIKVYKQRVKHLLFEHQNEIAESKTEGQESLKLKQEEQRTSESELKKDQRSLKVQLHEMELAHQDFLRSLRQEHDREMTESRLDFEREARELASKYEDRMRRTRTTLESQRKGDIQRIEDRKSAHIAQLMSSHDKGFAEIRAYYTDITHSNLDLIKSLKEEVAEMKKKEASDEKLMYEIAQENKRMSEPLKRALAEVKQLRAERESYRRDLEELTDVKRQLIVAEEKRAGARWELEVLDQRFDRLKAERDDLYEKFQHSVYDVQQKSGFKNLLLEKKLTVGIEMMEKAGAALMELLSNAGLDAAATGVVSKRLDEVVEQKDSAIRELQAELQRVVASHNRLVSGFERKRQEYGVPREELGFEPIREALYAPKDTATSQRQGGGDTQAAAPQRPSGGIAL